MAGRITDAHKKVFKELLVIDSIRGPHSTGVCMADRLGTTHGFVKKVGSPFELFDAKLFDTNMLGVKSLLLGHNRWATKGAINSTNAHPFECGTIIGAHNGTLRQQSLLDDWTKFDVDSENIYHHMSRHGVQETTPKLNGAYALTWHDRNDHTINFLRNEERPLYYCFSKDRKTLYWASENWMIMAALHRANLEYTEIFSLPINQHVKFKIPGGQFNAELPFEPAVIEETTPYKAPIVVHSYGNYGPKVQGANGSATTNVRTLPNEEKTARWLEYKPYLGVDVEFVVQTQAKTSTGEWYIQCVGYQDEAINMRVFTPRGSLMWENLLASCHGFKGTTKRYSPEEGGYLLVDIRSIVELPELFQEEIGNEDDGSGLINPPDEDEDVFLEERTTVYGGRSVSQATYNMLVKTGCAWCGDMTSWADKDDIKWINPEDHLCGQCKFDPSATLNYFN